MTGRSTPFRGCTRAQAALGTAAGVALVLALAPAELAPPSVRAAAAACALGAAAVLARARLAQPATARRLTVVSRQALSREAGLALVEVDGRSLLIGYGAGPVQLLDSTQAPAAPPTSLDPREAQL